MAGNTSSQDRYKCSLVFLEKVDIGVKTDNGNIQFSGHILNDQGFTKTERNYMKVCLQRDIGLNFYQCILGHIILHTLGMR